ncbi:MAG TPA: CHAT domain-containing tetratricopeptide repeat protein, partial [Niastella sp.]
LQKDYATGIKYTRQAIAIINENAGKPFVNRRHLIRNYNNLQICYDSLNQKAAKWAAIDSCISLAIELQWGFNYAMPLLCLRVEDLFNRGEYYRCIENADWGERLAREHAAELNNSGLVIDNFQSWKINSMNFMQEFKQAEDLVKTKIKQYQKNKDPKIGVWYSLQAKIIQTKGDFAQALSLYKKSYYYNNLIGNYTACSEVLNNIGYHLYFNLKKDYSTALTYYFRALPLATNIEALNIYDNIANAFAAKGQYDSAHYYFQQAFERLQPGITENRLADYINNHFDYGISAYLKNLFLDKAASCLDQFKIVKNIDLLQKAIIMYRLSDKLLDRIKNEQSENRTKLFWRADIHRLYEQAIEACYLARLPDEAFYFFEKSRAVILNDQLTQQRMLREEDILKLAQLKRNILRLTKDFSTAPPGSSQYHEMQGALYRGKQELEKFIKILQNNNPLYYQSFIDSSFITPGDVQQVLLSNHQAFAALFTGDSAVYFLIVTNGKTRLNKIDKHLYDSLTKVFTGVLSDLTWQNRHYNEFVNLSCRLYQLLFGEIALPAGRIIISPDGACFPFEALVTNYSHHTPRYFLQDHMVSYTYSARYLLNSFSTASSTVTLNFMGMAPMQYTASIGLAELPGSDYSLKQVQSNFYKANNFIGTAASRNNFLQSYPQYQIIQLYTHAADNSSRGEPVIYFADSALYLSELIGYTKPVTRLIVLSACETGRGKNFQGEGVFNFNRGFATLGIPSAVTNLWAIDNEATYRITELFYKFLADQLPPDIALQKAKLEYMQIAPKEKTLPFYWAASIFTGKTDLIELKKAFPWYWLLLVLGIGLVVLLYIFKRRLLTPPG